MRWVRNSAIRIPVLNLRAIQSQPINHRLSNSVDLKDVDDDIFTFGAYNVTRDYVDYLANILDYYEHESPISHNKKHEIVKCDASEGVTRYPGEHPETIVALAYFDFDIYKPTLDCFVAILSCLTRNSVIGFDELNNVTFPGETLAMEETLGLSAYKIQHSRFSPTQSYIVIQ